MSEVKVTVAPGEFTCFICKKKFKGMIETIDHCPDQKSDYSLTCDPCGTLIEQANTGDMRAKRALQALLKKNPSTAKFFRDVLVKSLIENRAE